MIKLWHTYIMCENKVVWVLIERLPLLSHVSFFIISTCSYNIEKYYSLLITRRFHFLPSIYAQFFQLKSIEGVIDLGIVSVRERLPNNCVWFVQIRD